MTDKSVVWLNIIFILYMGGNTGGIYMKKFIIAGLLVVSAIANASWWGSMSGGTRAAIIGGSALILNNSYQNSEIKHQRDLDRLDTDIRRPLRLELE